MRTSSLSRNVRRRSVSLSFCISLIVFTSAGRARRGLLAAAAVPALSPCVRVRLAGVGDAQFALVGPVGRVAYDADIHPPVDGAVLLAVVRVQGTGVGVPGHYDTALGDVAALEQGMRHGHGP